MSTDDTSGTAPGNDGAGVGGADGVNPPASRPRSSAAASAASRARRIGGSRPSTGQRPAGESDTAAGTPPAESDASSRGAADAAGTDDLNDTDHSSDVAAEGTTTQDAAADSGARRVVVTQAPRWLRWTPAAVLSACAVVMAVLLLVAAHSVWYAKPSSSALREKVLAAAKTCTAAANTYTYLTIPKDEANGLACSTGTWSSQYRKAMKTLVTPLATKLKASQAIQINAAGIENISASGHQWTVIVYGQTKITQASAKTRLDPFAAEVTMQEVGSKWLISNINTVANPDS